MDDEWDDGDDYADLGNDAARFAAISKNACARPEHKSPPPKKSTPKKAAPTASRSIYAAEIDRFLGECQAMKHAAASARFGHLRAGHVSKAVIELRIEGEISNTSDVLSTLAAHPLAEELRIRICSGGGLCNASNRVATAIAVHGAARKVAIVERAWSAAATVMFACTERLAVPGASVMVHPSTVELESEATLARCRVSDTIAEWFAKRAGIDVGDYRAALESAAELDVEAAVALGFLTGVADEEDALDIPTTYEGHTVSGDVVALPMPRQLVVGLAHAMRSGHGRGAVYGLAAPILRAAVRASS